MSTSLIIGIVCLVCNLLMLIFSLVGCVKVYKRIHKKC